MEIELKLLLDPADVAAFRRHPLLKQHALGKPVTQQLTSLYFDTPDGHLRRHDAGLRVRWAGKVGSDWIQTLKAGGQVVTGLHQRGEWESPVDAAQPDLARLRDLVGRDSALAKTLSAPELAAQLVPIFCTKVRRTLWQLGLAHGEQVELVLDQGSVQHGATRLPICEVELELKSGEPAALFDFALQLQERVPLRIGNISKAERGYALIAPQPPAASRATSRPVLNPRLETSANSGGSLRRSNCLAENDAAALTSDLVAAAPLDVLWIKKYTAMCILMMSIKTFGKTGVFAHTPPNT